MKFHEGMRRFEPMFCWRYVGEHEVCIRDRGHDNGAHEDKANRSEVDQSDLDRSNPATIILWDNGMIMSFDAAGNQMPAWQGAFDVLEARLEGLPAAGIIWQYGRWRGGMDAVVTATPKEAILELGRIVS